MSSRSKKMDKHNRDYAGIECCVRVSGNGFILTWLKLGGPPETIHRDFQSLVNEMGFHLGLLGIGEAVVLKEQEDG
jgi:hypothetical protein